jgi:hypothetical protein
MHLFQLLIAVQLPLVLLFLATADWTRPARPLLALAVQALAGAAALGRPTERGSSGDGSRLGYTRVGVSIFNIRI